MYAFTFLFLTLGATGPLAYGPVFVGKPEATKILVLYTPGVT